MEDINAGINLFSETMVAKLTLWAAWDVGIILVGLLHRSNGLIENKL